MSVNTQWTCDKQQPCPHVVTIAPKRQQSALLTRTLIDRLAAPLREGIRKPRREVQQEKANEAQVSLDLDNESSFAHNIV